MIATPPTTRVCFVIDRLLRGGTELHVLNLISSLDRNQVTPYLCLLDGSDELSGELIPQNCQSLRLGVRRLRSLYAARQAVRFAQFLRRERIDVVQMYFPDSTRFAAPIAKAMRVRSIVGTRRNIGHWMTKRDKQIARLYNWLFIDKIITNCEAARQAVIEQEQARPDRVEVVPNAIDLERFKHIPPWTPKPLGVPRKVGMVGNLRHVKGPDLFIEAAKLVLEQFPDTQFEIAGGGDPASYQQLINELGVIQQVRLLGPIEDVPAFLADLDVAVLPSRAEGLSNALMEYMAAGRPIVATDVGGNGELIQSRTNGLIADVEVVTLAANIGSLLADPQSSSHYAEAARRVCRERSSGSQCERYASLYLSNLPGPLVVNTSYHPRSSSVH